MLDSGADFIFVCKPGSHKGLYDSLHPHLMHSTGWFKARNSQRQRDVAGHPLDARGRGARQR